MNVKFVTFSSCFFGWFICFVCIVCARTDGSGQVVDCDCSDASSHSAPEMQGIGGVSLLAGGELGEGIQALGCHYATHCDQEWQWSEGQSTPTEFERVGVSSDDFELRGEFNDIIKLVVFC